MLNHKRRLLKHSRGNTKNWYCMHECDESISLYFLRRIKETQVKSWQSTIKQFYRFVAKQIVFSMYNIKAIGFENIPKEGPALLICNHISYMDGPILNAVCSRHIRFIIDKEIFQQPGIHYFMSLAEAIPITPKRESIERAMQDISDGLRKGDLICIFPEGQITYTGFMSHFRPGTEWIIKRDPVPIYPIIIDGLWGSVFSRKYYGLFWRFIPRSFRKKVTVVCGHPIVPENITIDELQIKMLELRDYTLQQAKIP